MGHVRGVSVTCGVCECDMRGCVSGTCGGVSGTCRGCEWDM